MILTLQMETRRTASYFPFVTTGTFLANLVEPIPIWQEESEKVHGVITQNMVS